VHARYRYYLSCVSGIQLLILLTSYGPHLQKVLEYFLLQHNRSLLKAVTVVSLFPVTNRRIDRLGGSKFYWHQSTASRQEMARKANGINSIVTKVQLKEAEMVSLGNRIPELNFGNLSWRVTTRKCWTVTADIFVEDEKTLHKFCIFSVRGAAT